jgi:hypothetical protein
MASPTGTPAKPPASQAATQGVTPGHDPARDDQGRDQAGRPPSVAGTQQTPTTAPAEPVLFEDIEPVLLARLHPEALAGGLDSARAKALEAGRATHAAGRDLVADQQAYGTSAPPTTEPSSTRPQTAPTRPDEAPLHGQPTAAGQAYPIQQHADPEQTAKPKTTDKH